jgi:hypothetical protein
VAPHPGDRGTVVVDSRADVSPGEVIASSGAVLERSRGGTDYAVSVQVRPAAIGWGVSGVAKE